MSRYMDSTNVKPSHISPAKAHRKIVKPLMEKKRRARINASLNELKSLLVEALHDQGCRHSNKMEKADILEMAVKHLKSLQAQERLQSSPIYSTPPPAESNSHIYHYKTDGDRRSWDCRTVSADTNNNRYSTHTTDAAVTIPYQSIQLLPAAAQPSPISATTHHSKSNNSFSGKATTTCQPYTAAAHQAPTAYLATNAKGTGGADLTLIVPVNGIQQGTQLPVRIILPLGFCNDTRADSEAVSIINGVAEGASITRGATGSVSNSITDSNAATTDSVAGDSNSGTAGVNLHGTLASESVRTNPPLQTLTNPCLLKPAPTSPSAFHPVSIPACLQVTPNQLVDSTTSFSQRNVTTNPNSLVWRPW